MKKKYFNIGRWGFLLTLIMSISWSTQVAGQSKKILVIGVDGIINTALDYATTPGVDRLLSQASYSMNGFAGVPAYSSTGWATLLTGVSPGKHGTIQNNSFEGNKFNTYPSVVKRIKDLNPAIKVASIVRDADINEVLNSAADEKFNFNTDQQVASKAAEVLQQSDIGAVFVQFSSPAEIGKTYGYQLREAQYVLAIQQVDNLVEQLLNTINDRTNYANESWAVFLVSTHGGTESGTQNSNTIEEFNVPVILSGGDLDSKELLGNVMPPRENADNILTINRASSGEGTYVRIPINGTPLKGMNKFTIEMWIKAGPNSSDPVIMGDKDWDSGGNPGFVLCRSGNTWKINIANEKRERYDIGSTRSIEDGNWHHIAVTFDKTNECIVYQNGVLMAESKLTYKPEDNLAAPFDYLCLAQEGTGRYDGGAPNWAGSFNEVRIWTDVLSQETLRQYMYQRNVETSDHPQLNALNLYLKMDEIRGNIIQDHSGKGHHGELVGPASERHPLYPIGLTDVAINILSHLGFRPDGSWGLDGQTLKSNVPFRLFKVN